MGLVRLNFGKDSYMDNCALKSTPPYTVHIPFPAGAVPFRLDLLPKNLTLLCKVAVLGELNILFSIFSERDGTGCSSDCIAYNRCTYKCYCNYYKKYNRENIEHRMPAVLLFLFNSIFLKLFFFFCHNTLFYHRGHPVSIPAP